MKTLTKPIKVHGGKDQIAGKIIDLMPPRCKNPNAPDADDKGWLHYVAAYAGGESVGLAMDPEGISEVWNDSNFDIINFFRTLQRPSSYGVFRRLVQGPFSKAEFNRARNELGTLKGNTIQRAANFFVNNRMSHSGRMKEFAAISRNRTRGGMNEQASAWLGAIDGLADIHARLSRVLLLCQPAIDVIASEDGPRTLFYLDPPYLKSTRVAQDVYGDYEMSDRAHAILLATLSKPNRNKLFTLREFEGLKGLESYHDFIRAWKRPMQGRFLLSGYESPLYHYFATCQGWQCHKIKVPNSAAGGKKKRIMTECVWTNYANA